MAQFFCFFVFVFCQPIVFDIITRETKLMSTQEVSVLLLN